MCRHIYDWNIVACDVILTPIYTHTLTHKAYLTGSSDNHLQVIFMYVYCKKNCYFTRFHFQRNVTYRYRKSCFEIIRRSLTLAPSVLYRFFFFISWKWYPNCFHSNLFTESGTLTGLFPKCSLNTYLFLSITAKGHIFSIRDKCRIKHGKRQEEWGRLIKKFRNVWLYDFNVDLLSYDVSYWRRLTFSLEVILIGITFHPLKISFHVCDRRCRLKDTI